MLCFGLNRTHDNYYQNLILLWGKGLREKWQRLISLIMSTKALEDKNAYKDRANMREEYDFSKAWRVKHRGKTLKVYYHGPLDPEMDKDILSAYKLAGFKWYASGYDFTTDVREHCFDAP